jgi:FkbM family methyltransferase
VSGLTGRCRAWHARGVKLAAILRYGPYRRALCLGVAAATEHAHTPLPYDYATVVDVGASRGQFALVARRRFPHALITCVEPLARPRATLERVFTDRTRVRVIGSAVAASAGETRMFVSRADDSSSLLAPTELQLSAFPGTEVAEQISLRTERLDALLGGEPLPRPALLKIDVQGGELDVLSGATGLLDRIDTILVECSFVELYENQPLADEIVRFLDARAFRLASMASPFVDARGQVVQADLVFARADMDA